MDAVSRADNTELNTTFALAAEHERKLAYRTPTSMFSTFDGVSEKREDRVADEWVTQLLRQSDARVFKKYSQMKLQMKR